MGTLTGKCASENVTATYVVIYLKSLQTSNSFGFAVFRNIKEVQKMYKKLFAILLAVTLMVSFLTGCSSSSTKSARDNYAQTPRTSAYEAGSSNSIDWDSGAVNQSYTDITAAGESAAELSADSLAGFGGASVDVENVILAERKIIRSANLTIEVEDFDTAFSNIENIILGIGFIQETNINTDRVYIDGEVKLVKSGSIVLRVDKTKFDNVISKLRGIGDVYNYTTNGEDVTEQYFDIESRLRLLKLEQEKLESYLAKLDDLDDIFKVESRLTELRYQIESLTGKLNKLSSLVDLSTITIQLNEKRPDYNPKPVTYGERLLNSLKESFAEVVEFLGDLLVFTVSALPALILLALLILICVWIFRKIVRKSKAGSLIRQHSSADAAAPLSQRPDAVDAANRPGSGEQTDKTDGADK